MVAKKFLVEMLILAITVVVMLWMFNRSGKSASENYWKAEQEAQAKRLFGDAWKEAMKLD